MTGNEIKEKLANPIIHTSEYITTYTLAKAVEDLCSGMERLETEVAELKVKVADLDIEIMMF